jgi:nucleoside-diphosphate-sugar epimerase
MTQHIPATLEGVRVLVKGGAGLAGSHIVDHLLKERVEMVSSRHSLSYFLSTSNQPTLTSAIAL